MATKVIRIGRSPDDVFGHAAKVIHNYFENDLAFVTDQTVKVSKSITPVYDPLKYPTWSRMPHARGAHGLLKASVKRKPIRRTPRTFKTAVYSNKRYSSYVEHGFNHSIARRHIRGRKFIGVPMKVVHQRLLPIRLSKSVFRSLEGL